MTTFRPQTARGLFGNSIALLATTQITGLLGYVFWMVCAHCFSASVIGVTNTVIAAMTLVAMLAVSGFVPMLTRLLPGASSEERSGLCSTAFLVTGVTSAVAGVAVGLLLPERLHVAVGTGWLVALVGAGTVGTGMQLVVSAALLGVRRAELSLLAGVVGSVSRLAAIAALLTLGILAVGVDASAAHTILTLWVLSLMISVVLSMWLFAHAIQGFRFRPRLFWITRVRRSVGWDHVAALAVRAPIFVIPILASAIFPPAKLGYLAVTAMIASAFFAVAAAVSNALLADCANDPGRLRAQARRALRLIGALLLAPVMITCLFAKEVLSIFGAHYADYSPLLILLLLATFPDALINVAVAILRVQRRLPMVAALTVTGAAISIGGAWLLMPHLGIFGAGLAPLIAQLIVAAAFAVMGSYRFLRSPRTAAETTLVCAADEPSLAAADAEVGMPRRRNLGMGRL